MENGAQKAVRPEGPEHMPLKQRLKLLLSSPRATVPVLLPKAGVSVAEERENGQFYSQEEINKSLTISNEGNAGYVDDLGGCQESLIHKHGSSSDVIADSHQGSLLAKHPVIMEIACAENLAESNSNNHLNEPSLAGMQSFTFEPETSKEYLQEFDHITLKERLRRLLTRKSLKLTSPLLQENSTAAVKGDLRSGDHQNAMSENQMHEIDQALTSDSMGIKRNDKMPFPEKECSGYGSAGGKTLLSRGSKTGKGSALPTLAKIKIEQLTYDKIQTCNLPTDCQMPFWNLVQVKSEVQNAVYEYEDELDHMLLRERMKLLSSRELDINQTSKYPSKVVSSGFLPVASRPSQSLKINRSRKRRKTATDSVQTAMEEDAPGLLQVLLEKGVSVNEIKLYGEPESNDALDDSSNNDDFGELEEVISKVFSQRESLLKFGPLRCNKGERASYCLGCLFALVEQVQYLRFRNWPVEWGWCRDLQSFIFVFEKHNRIVLERPEYGYAMYIFELAESWPISWQLKRLVTAMKLTSCSRTTLIENKVLTVGDDLTEGEARVLMEYGWLPNTGLRTMLNYYDRVVHDRKSEDISDWRSKIGKLLTDGYNSGRITSTSITPKVEYDLDQQIKLELT